MMQYMTMIFIAILFYVTPCVADQNIIFLSTGTIAIYDPVKSTTFEFTQNATHVVSDTLAAILLRSQRNNSFGNNALQFAVADSSAATELAARIAQDTTENANAWADTRISELIADRDALNAAHEAEKAAEHAALVESIRAAILAEDDTP